MVLIVCARAPCEATWCLSTPVVAQPASRWKPRKLCAPASQRVCLLHRGTGRFITRANRPSPKSLNPRNLGFIGQKLRFPAQLFDLLPVVLQKPMPRSRFSRWEACRSRSRRAGRTGEASCTLFSLRTGGSRWSWGSKGERHTSRMTMRYWDGGSLTWSTGCPASCSHSTVTGPVDASFGTTNLMWSSCQF
jgi:hypothetical protein